MARHQFKAAFFFCGIGGGALGFVRSLARLGGDEAEFVNLGGTDFDPEACADFRRITGGPALQADMHAVTPAELRAFFGEAVPDCVFASPPCKGASALLSTQRSKTPEYQAMNELVYKGIFLACETWAERPPLIVLENVPRIRTRMRAVLDKAKGLLRHYGYLLHEGTHDCGQIGGLAQHRKRYLLVARQPQRVKAFVHRPPLQRVRGCGEELGQLPLPNDPAAGPLHQLPRLDWLTWVRLAWIPAGGDWRDLPGMQPQDAEARKRWEQKGEKTPGEVHWFKGKHGVGPWTEPAKTVIGGPGNGAQNVADPRVAQVVPLHAERAAPHALALPWKGRPDNWNDQPGKLGVLAFDQPAHAVTGSATVTGSNTPAAVAQPLSLTHAPRSGSMGVQGWDQPVPTVCGQSRPSNCTSSVAQPLLVAQGALALSESAGRHNAKLRVEDWAEPAHTVTGSKNPNSGMQSVADARVADVLTTPLKPGQKRREVFSRYALAAWDQPSKTVDGPGTNGAFGVADEWVAQAGLALGCAPRAGTYGVLSWLEAAATVTGHARVDTGAFAVGDPRIEGLPVILDKQGNPLPLILAEDGTWHRAMTPLDLAVLQGLPAVLEDGQPLTLAGKNKARWLERIGNCVPVGAGTAIGNSMLKALLASRLGTWSLSTEGVWVKDSGEQEDVAELGEPALHPEGVAA